MGTFLPSLIEWSDGPIWIRLYYAMEVLDNPWIFLALSVRLHHNAPKRSVPITVGHDYGTKYHVSISGWKNSCQI
ncbi:hypothetical protein [Flagellimonas sp.]|uniref:hypothetical protein n=1 Tax=Flagellimonas sp. TaxID=2058762 RepID=UPI003C7E6790